MATIAEFRARIIELAYENLGGDEKMDKLVAELVDKALEGADLVLALPEPAETLSDVVLKAVRPILERQVRAFAQSVYDDIRSKEPELLGIAPALRRKDVQTLNFTLAELERSGIAQREGIDNAVPDELLPDALALMEQAQVIRRKCGRAVVVSGYRGVRVQEVIYADVIAKLKAKKTKAAREKIERILSTQHAKAQALDLRFTQYSRDHVLGVIRELQRKGEIDLDQCIWYEVSGKKQTIHISHKRAGGNRGMFFEADRQGSAVGGVQVITSGEG